MSNLFLLRFLEAVRAEELDYLSQWIADPVPTECLNHLRYLIMIRHRQSYRNPEMVDEFQQLAEIYKRLLKQRTRSQFDVSCRVPAQELKYLVW